jgi:hypothetical protein
MGKFISFLIFTMFIAGLLFANAALVLKANISDRNIELNQIFAGVSK